MNTVLTTLRDADEARAFLLAACPPGPSLHPHVNSGDPWTRWNGWNQALAVGVDANGVPVTLVVSAWATGGHDYATGRAGEIAGGGSLAFRNITFPVTALPAAPRLLHPEHTPDA